MAGRELRELQLQELARLVDSGTTSFQWIPRRKFCRTTTLTFYNRHVVRGGLPLMLTGTMDDWMALEPGEFHWSNLAKLMGPDRKLKVRDNATMQDVDLTYTEYDDFLSKCVPGSPNEALLPFYYGKDLVAPPSWIERTFKFLPEYFQERKHGDLLDCPGDITPETLMCYIGVNGTYTCGHFDICSSLGHNLLLDSDPGPTSIWFMTRSQDHAAASAFWALFGGSLEKDNCYLPVDLLAKAPFTVYVAFQGKGDFVLVPSDSAHQVFNKGRNVKISWNRLPPSCIEAAYFNALPRYRYCGHPEVYRTISLCYHGLLWRTQNLRALLDSFDLVGQIQDNDGNYQATTFMEYTFKKDEIMLRSEEVGSLINVLADVVFEESFNADDKLFLLRDSVYLKDSNFELLQPECSPIDNSAGHHYVCDICKCDIFCRFMKCLSCADDCAFCLNCAAMSRGCRDHPNELRLVELRPLQKVKRDLEDAYEVLRCAEEKSLTQQCITPLKHLLSRHVRSKATIALLLSCNRLKRSNVACHQCSESPRAAVGRNGLSCPTCKLRFCSSCVFHWYREDLSACLRSESWQCYRCRGICNCENCREESFFQAHQGFEQVSIDSVQRSRLSEGDFCVPHVLYDGIGSKEGDCDVLAPTQVFPRRLEISQLGRLSLLIAPNRAGIPWPCIRAFYSESTPESDNFPLPHDVLVRFMGISGADSVGWVGVTNLRIVGDFSNLAKFMPANDAIRSQWIDAIHEYRKLASLPNDEVYFKSTKRSNRKTSSSNVSKSVHINSSSSSSNLYDEDNYNNHELLSNPNSNNNNNNDNKSESKSRKFKAKGSDISLEIPSRPSHGDDDGICDEFIDEDVVSEKTNSKKKRPLSNVQSKVKQILPEQQKKQKKQAQSNAESDGTTGLRMLSSESAKGVPFVHSGVSGGDVVLSNGLPRVAIVFHVKVVLGIRQ